jgi:Ulp1 family protease
MEEEDEISDKLSINVFDDQIGVKYCLKCLEPCTYLNDEVINFMLNIFENTLVEN